jgi:hypothetical protein
MLECLAHMQANPALLTQMKQASRRRFLESFQSARMTDDLLALISRPTVDRSLLPHELDILRWRTPLRADGKKARLLDRIFIRLGLLRHAGKLALADSSGPNKNGGTS